MILIIIVRIVIIRIKTTIAIIRAPTQMFLGSYMRL